MSQHVAAETGPASIPEPPLSRLLFADTRLSALWALLRIWLGWKWLTAGIGKVGQPAWTGANAGMAVQGFLGRALEDPNVPGWYAWLVETVFLPAAPLLGWLVAWGEVLVGLGLILGLLTGIAAFAGTLMNLAFLFSGTISTNPMMFVVGTWLVLAWRNAGWYGLDRWALPMLGTPWHRGKLFQPEDEQTSR